MTVQSAQASATATLYGKRCKLQGIHWVGAATAGTLVFKDGGSGGVTKLTINTPGITTSGETPSGYIPLPGNGMQFSTDLYCAVTTTAFLTVFYETDAVP